MFPFRNRSVSTVALVVLLGAATTLSTNAAVTLQQVSDKAAVNPDALAKTVTKQWVLATADGEGGRVQLWNSEIKFFGEGKVILGSSSEQIFVAVVSGVCSVASEGQWVNGLATGQVAFWGHDGRSQPKKGIYDALAFQDSLNKADRPELAEGLNGAVFSQRKKLRWGFLRSTKLNLASPLSPEVETLRRSYLNQPEVIESRRTAPSQAKLPAEVAMSFLKHLKAGTASEASHLISPRLFEAAATQGQLEQARADFTKDLLGQAWPKQADPASLKMDETQPLMGEFTAGEETYVIHLEPFDAGLFVKSVIPTFGRLIAALAVISLWLTTSTAHAATKDAADTEAKAIVVSVVGKVLINYGDAAPEEATLKMVLREGATINTGNNSKIVLDLGPNGSALSINANSTLVLDELKLASTPQGPAAKTTLDLKRGGLIGNTKKLSQASKYEVRTANGVAGIRGTSFRFLATGLWQCFSGLVQVSANGDSFSVDPGKMLDFKAGKPSLDNIPADQLRAFVAEARMIVTLIGNLATGFNGASIQQHMNNFNGGASGEKVDVKTLAAFEHFSQQVQVLESFVSARLAMNEGNNLLNSPIINLNNSTADIQQRFLNAGFLETAAFSNVGGDGLFRGQLSWATSNDLDLHLILPDGTHVYYGHTSATFADGMAQAILDHDNLGGVIDVPPNLRVENIVVNPVNGATEIPSGTYQFYVHNFSGPTTDATLRYTANGAQNVNVVNLTLNSGQTTQYYPVTVGTVSGPE